MEIRSIRHKALRHYVETGQAKGLDAQLLRRIRNMIAFLVVAQDSEDLRIPPNFGFHWLTGDRKGTAAMTLTKNWRMTFTIDDEGMIADLDLEDYH
jgi:toxin HigB-1